MGRYALKDFLAATQQRDRDQGHFELESERILEVNLAGSVWTKSGSMIAYSGDIAFTREGILEHGLGKLFKKALTGEGARLTKADGHGKLYLADVGKKISILELSGEAVYVNGNDLLAFEETLEWNVEMMKKISAMLAGGLFNLRIQGSGLLAFTTHYEPLTLAVRPGQPVFTDPNATVAWASSLKPEFKTDVSLKSFFGRGSGESFQMKFDGTGFVVVQPFEEVAFQGEKSNG